MRHQYPHLFSGLGIFLSLLLELVYSFRGRNVPKEGGFCNTPSRESVQYMIL